MAAPTCKLLRHSKLVWVLILKLRVAVSIIGGLDIGGQAGKAALLPRARLEFSDSR